MFLYEVYSGYYQHKSLYGEPVRFDVSEKNTVREISTEIKPNVVVNAAALTNVDKCEEEKELAWKINVGGYKKYC